MLIAYKQTTIHTVATLLLMFIALIIPDIAIAAEGQGGGLPYEPWLRNLAASVTGPVAFTISLIGIVAAGMGLVFGADLNGFFRAIFVLVLVISLIIGAQNLLSGFFGRGADMAITLQQPVNGLIALIAAIATSIFFDKRAHHE